MNFVHLHNHTEYSLLDGAGKIGRLIKKACECGMPACGISDHGNMFGVPEFVNAAKKAGIKPVIGCEFYLCANRHEKTTIRKSDEDDSPKAKEKSTFHQILWAKNEQGYKNLIKLTSIAYEEGYYYKPRIDRELLAKHAEGLIASTCCLGSEINQLIINNRIDEAERIFNWYRELFGDDYYVEVQRHGLALQERCNQVLLRWAAKYNVKVIATNDVHYVEREDAEAHDVLLALQTGKELSDPSRFRFTGDDNQSLNPNFFFKTPAEMQELFSDLPHALDNTLEIADKVDFKLNLAGQMLLPVYQIPEGFASQDEYLKFLAYEGAKKRYGELSTDVVDRIDTELAIIARMGYAGYFLIVQEFTNEARRRGVFVGPGRGSAAGSVVAYCTGIIDIDPIHYALLFERFLNPERVSPPDIDMDFDDEGRQQVIDFVVQRYGRRNVSQIVTYGTMGAKTALRDVGRTLGIPLAEVNRISKYIPEKPGITFEKALTSGENPEFASQLQEAVNSPDPGIQRMMRYAMTLEGSVRQVGIHAAGVIIAPGEVSDFVPTAVNNSRDNIVITQYEGPMAEAAGMLKMDFLGLRTLSILKTAQRLVQETTGTYVDIDTIPLDDAKTYELYQAGETVATFQFESDGMRKYLRQLRPTNIEDLIAMNALYRPGPMDNIPSFVERKNGRQAITYLHPLLEPILSNTYGIMVYQEQIMQIARDLGGYTLGGADMLRRAMGKKKVEEMEKERARFTAGALERGIDKKVASEIFDVMEKFANYGFNKSHAAAYSVLAFRTGYFKAHYPAQYMAAVLSHNLSAIDKISFFMEECRRMKLNVLPPCVNESKSQFYVNAKGEIRFGLGAIKGLGDNTAQAIIEEQTNGPFASLFDFTARVPSKSINKKSLECLVYAGALDAFGVERARFFTPLGDGTVMDRALVYGSRKQSEADSQQDSLFGGGGPSSTYEMQEPEIPYAEPWPALQQLNYERDTIGFYLSGHPLDRHRLAISTYANSTTDGLNEIRERLAGREQEVKVAGIVTGFQTRVEKKSGNPFGIVTLEDYSGKLEFSLFKEDYARHKGFLEVNNCVLVVGNYKPSYRNPAEYELKVREVRLLDAILEEQARELRLMLPLNQIDEAIILELETLLAQHKGTCSLRFGVSNPDGRMLTLQSGKYSVRPSTELFQTLDSLQLTYVLK